MRRRFPCVTLPGFVDDSGGERVFDTEPVLRGRHAEAYEHVALAGSRVSDEAKGLVFADPVADCEGVDGVGVDDQVRFELECLRAASPGENRRLSLGESTSGDHGSLN